MPASVVALIVPVELPPERLNTTVAPPTVIELPAASLACKVSVEVPPELIVALPTNICEVAELGPPGVTVTLGAAVVTLVPPILAVIVVAEPATAPVKVAVYVPLALSVVPLTTPVEVPPV